MDLARALLGPLRLALLIVLFFLVLALVIAIGRPESGLFEKLVLGAAVMRTCADVVGLVFGAMDVPTCAQVPRC